MVIKILLYGHSFVSHLKSFIQNEQELSYSFNLDPARFMVQFSAFPGCDVTKLQSKTCLEIVQDFNPDILVLIVGTCGIYNNRETAESVSEQICNLVKHLHYDHEVGHVVVFQTLHRIPNTVRTKYPVDCSWFNERIDTTNHLLNKDLPKQYSKLWRLKGFWSDESKMTAFAADGVHLSSLGNRKLYNNVRAAIITGSKAL